MSQPLLYGLHFFWNQGTQKQSLPSLSPKFLTRNRPQQQAFPPGRILLQSPSGCLGLACPTLASQAPAPAPTQACMPLSWVCMGTGRPLPLSLRHPLWPRQQGQLPGSHSRRDGCGHWLLGQLPQNLELTRLQAEGHEDTPHASPPTPNLFPVSSSRPGATKLSP